MGTSNFSDEFKRDAVHQITVCGYPVREDCVEKLGTRWKSVDFEEHLPAEALIRKPCLAMRALHEQCSGFWARFCGAEFFNTIGGVPTLGGQ